MAHIPIPLKHSLCHPDAQRKDLQLLFKRPFDSSLSANPQAPHISISLKTMGAPGPASGTWENLKVCTAGIGGIPGLKIQTWGTQIQLLV